MKKKLFDRQTEKVLTITLVPIFIVALVLCLNQNFPNLYNPYLWTFYRKSSIFSIIVRYGVPAVSLSLISVRYIPIFFILQAPCVLVFADQWFSHQISSLGPDEFLFLGVYGLLMPIVSVVLARVYPAVFQKIFDKL